MRTDERLAAATAAALAELGVEVTADQVVLTRPQRLEHGDWSTNVALAAAKRAGRPPRELAQSLAAALGGAGLEWVEAVEVAGPGFVNFRLGPGWLHDALRTVVADGEAGYAAPGLGAGERVQIEFVSANPTGPVHVGNGWFGSYGDALGRVMARCGWQVQREYYVNDTGGQIRLLGESLLARRRGEQVPDEGYQGEYVAQPRRAVRRPGRRRPKRAGSRPSGSSTTSARRSSASRSTSTSGTRRPRSKRRVPSPTRSSCCASGGSSTKRAAPRGSARPSTATTATACSIKSNGDATYLAGDLAYHRDKFLVRGFDRVIDVLGADHHGQVASLKAGIAALGVDPERLEVRLGQLVSLAEGRMSKRSGVYVALDQLIDEIGPDATRLMSLLSSIDQATTIDLEIVRKQSMENPVYYVQYAHARIASIDRMRAERGIERVPVESADLSLLVHQRELELLRWLVDLPFVVGEAARERAPYKVTNWARSIAGEFHGFYHDCRILGDEVPAELTQARLWLVEAVRVGLAIALDLLGVHAPDSM